MEKTCAQEDCGRPRVARGLCSAHYQQAKAAGTLDQIAPNPSTTCEYCHQPIPKGRRWGARYCSTEHKQAAVDAARAAALTDRRAAQHRLCAWCREPLTGDQRQGTRFCSREHLDLWHREQKRLAMLRAKKVARRLCEVCGKPIPETRRGNAIYCSPEHKRLGQQSGSPKVRRDQQAYNRQYLYGLPAEDFQALLAAQGGRCAICRTDQWTGRGPHVDHDHDGGAVRGILCHDCNLGLGRFKDDPALLRAAIRYLEGASEQGQGIKQVTQAR